MRNLGVDPEARDYPVVMPSTPPLMRLTIGLLGLGLCLAACGGTQSGVFSSVQATVTPAPTGSPTVAPTPSPTVDPAAAGRAYLAAVDALKAIQCTLGSSQDFELAKADAATMADALRVFADTLRKIAMPAGLEDDQQDLLRAVAASEQAARSLSTSVTPGEFDARADTADARMQEAAAISNLIRGELGLESSPGGC
jgi:hypothetical protein